MAPGQYVAYVERRLPAGPLYGQYPGQTAMKPVRVAGKEDDAPRRGTTGIDADADP